MRERIPSSVESAPELETPLRAEVGTAAAASAAPGTMAGRPPPVVDDSAADLLDGQQRATAFLASLEQAARGVIGPTGIPGQIMLAQQVSELSALPASRLLAQLAQAVPEATSAGSAAGLRNSAVARLGRQVRTWHEAERSQSLLPPLLKPVAGQPPEPGVGATGEKPSEAGAVARELGSGRPLGSGQGARFRTALGTDVSGVRIHTDSRAAALAGRLGARAFTVGDDVAFAPGQFRPGEPVGDALLAHELAHVAQQRSAGAAVAAKSTTSGGVASLEADADQTAVEATLSLWGEALGWAGRVARRTGPRLRSGLQLQRCTCSPTPTPTPVPKRVDLHGGAQVPDATTQQAILNTLMPGRLAPAAAPAAGGPAAAPVQLPWKGAADPVSGTVSPAAAASRAALKTALTNAVLAELNSVNTDMLGEEAAYAAARMPTSSFEGAGAAAKQVVDTVYGSYASAAALSAADQTHRSSFAFTASGANPNLLDAYDPADRIAVNQAISAEAVIEWILGRPPSQTAMAAERCAPARGNEAEVWLNAEVVTPLANGPRKADFERYDRFGFAITSDDAGVSRVVIPTTRDTSRPSVSEGEKAAKWANFETLIHEYIHVLEHPNFTEGKAQASDIMTEGFTEWLTKPAVEAAYRRLSSDVALRRTVEGTPAGDPDPPNPVGNFLGPTYSYVASYADQANAIASLVPHVTDAGLKAVYFLGHVEYLGLDPTGNAAAPATTRGEVDTPSGVTTVAQLSALTGVSEADLRASNPGLPASGSPLPATLTVPGFTQHVVIEHTSGATTKTETIADVARQHGLTEAQIRAYNPGLVGASLTVGQKVLIRSAP